MAEEEEDEPMGPDVNPRRAAMEAYGARPDVHDLLSRFMTDLLCTQPESILIYFYIQIKNVIFPSNIHLK